MIKHWKSSIVIGTYGGPKTLTFSIKYDIHIGMKKLNFTGGLYEDL